MDANKFRNKHAAYRKYFEYIEMAHDFYTGECALEEKAQKYLHQKPQGEANEGYVDRVKNSSYINDLARIVDSNTGAIFGSEDDANFIWEDEAGNGLGDPTTPGTLAYRLSRNCDGNGASMETMIKKFTRDLQLYPWTWKMVDTEYDGNGVLFPVWRDIPPMAVVNWVDGREVLIKEEIDVRESVFDDDSLQKTEAYLHITLNGFTRYRVDGDKVTILEERTHSYVDRFGRPTLPIRRDVSPLSRHVGLNIAMQSKSLYNMQSELLHMLRNANFPLMNVHAEGTGFEKVIAGLVEGGRAIEAGREGKGISFAAPPTDSAAIKAQAIQEARQTLYETSFQEFGDAAKEKTATQIDAESASGFGAFIELMRSSIDDIQNFLFDITAQVQWSSGPGVSNWFVANVQRSTRALPLNPDQVIENIRTKYFGDTALPLGKTAQVEGARQIAEILGVQIDEATLQQQMDLLEIQRIIAGYTESGLEVPAPIVERLGVIAAQVLGIPEAEMVADANDRVESQRAGAAGLQALMAGIDGQDTEDDQGDMTDGEDA